MSSNTDTPDQTILQGDCIDEMQAMVENSVHAVVTDPPYNFEGGFMGEEWDDIGTLEEYREWCGVWASEALRVLKPGGHLIAFSGSRTHSHLFCGVHDAGFEIRDTLTWHYSSGMPKGSDIGKHIDANAYEREHDVNAFRDYIKEARVERGLSTTDVAEHFADDGQEPTGCVWNWENVSLPDWENYLLLKDILDLDDRFDELMAKEGADREVVGYNDRPAGWFTQRDGHEITEAATSEAARWDGWKQNLKPATEFAVLARKPLSENATYKNVLEHGTGALNISAAEIEGDDRDRYPSNVAMGEGATDIPERYFYTSKASKLERTVNGQIENGHVSVKPLDLMEWLVTLVTAPGQRVLDPFAGSGTTIMACRRLGREGLGIEMDEDHAVLARKRVDLAHELETGRPLATEGTVDESDDEPATLESFGDD